jgi:uncharacterized protein
MFSPKSEDLTAEPVRPLFYEAESPPIASHLLTPVGVLSSRWQAPLNTNQGLIRVTDDMLLNFQRCKRRAFLDIHGSTEHRDPPSDYLLKLHQDSLAHQQSVFVDYPSQEPDYPRHDWDTGADATLELMQRGVERIVRGVLQVELVPGVRVLSRPKLLVRQDGHSIFGDWYYAPVDIKLGKRPKLDYQVIAAFHAYILSEIQGVWPDTSWLILRQRGAYAVNLSEQVPRMEGVLENCVRMLTASDEPEVFISRNRCDLCHWFSHCYSIAQSNHHLSLMPGVTPSRYVHLQELNLTTVVALANSSPDMLATLPGFGVQTAHKLVQQARSTLHNQALLSPLLKEDDLHALHSGERLPTAPVELYFDIEAAPEQNLIYLHGVLIVERDRQRSMFMPLLAEHSDHEEQIWQQFLELVWQYPDAPIFHFCPYEVQTVKRLAATYNTPDGLIQPLLHRFIDLHECVTQTVALPIESYSLKPIARWLGFDWRDQEANGAQSIYWYDQWLNTGDRAHLEAILRYNEDDCRATHHVKDWLVQFIQHKRFQEPFDKRHHH